MHTLTLNQNPRSETTEGRRLSMQSPTPSHHEDPKGRTRRFRGGGASFPLLDVGKGFPTIVHCRQWDPKELDFSGGHEAVGFSNHSTPAAVHHRVASPRKRLLCQPTVSTSLQHQALHRWGIMWYFSSWCLWCIIRSTILMEVTCCVWVPSLRCYYYVRK